MSTTLANCRILLSKQLGDYWASTTTAAGDTGKKTLVDGALTEKTNDWITDECSTLITESGDTSEDDERKIGSLDPNTGTISCRAHTAQIASGTDYEIHRLFSASEKRRALVHAAKASVNHIFKQIWDETKAVDSDSVHTKIDISGLGLARNKPHQIFQSRDKDDDDVHWVLLRNYTVDKDGYLRLSQGTCGYDLRIIGIGYLGFLDDDGNVSTAWDAEIDIDSPQTEILVAEAAIYLCNQMIIPTETSGESERWMQALGYWKAELRDRQSRFGMQAPSATVHWR